MNAKYILMLGATALLASSCSNDYLDLAPEDQLATSSIFSNTETVKGAVNGLGKIMSQKYASSGFGRQGYNGEATISLWYGSYMGKDAQYSNATSYDDLVNLECFTLTTTGANYFPWYYYFTLISNANAIINNVDAASGLDSEKNFYKAQALTYRAHAYLQLVSLYSKRWSDSRNGASRGVPLRLDESRDDIACASLGQIYTQIYKDLDDAIQLYGQSNESRSNTILVDESVAHGIYARAALNKEDWDTAATHAAAARKGYSLMGADEYKEGFNTPNGEWMWNTHTDAAENLGVYGFFAYVGANTASSKGYKNIGSISKELVEQIPADDARLWLYMIPQEGESGWDTTDSGRAKKGSFYDRVMEEYADKISPTNTYIYAYMSVKYQKIDDRSIGDVCLMRAAEMIYAEAEARYMMGGQEATVRSLLEEAVAPYQDNYACDLSGQALLDEVKLYKRFDLWAEGRGWFDQKRWGEDNIRLGWNEGGNWHPYFCGRGVEGGTYTSDEKNHWAMAIPRKETDYNKLINQAIEPDNWTASSPEE